MVAKKFVLRAVVIALAIFVVVWLAYLMVDWYCGETVGSVQDWAHIEHWLPRNLVRAELAGAFLVSLPAEAIAGWILRIRGPELLEVTAFLGIGSLVWGAVIAAVWTGIEWLRVRRASAQPQRSGPP